MVQARDFVEQWDKAQPGEGSTAIRAVLSQLSDPTQQRAFLGGDPPKGTPFGVLKPDAADATQAQDWVYDPVGKTAYLRGTKPVEKADIRDAKWRPGDEAKPVPLPDNPKDQEPRWVYDPITGDARWVEPKKIQLMSSDRSADQAHAKDAGRDSEEFNHGLLAPYLDRREAQVGAGIQVAQNSGSMTDANSDDEKRGDASGDSQEARARNEAHHDRFFEKYVPIAEKLGDELGVSKEWILALISRENGWERDGPNPQNNPFDMMTPSGKKQYESLDAAVEDWKNTWGPRVKDSVDFEDFIRGLQTRGRWPYNSAESETNHDRKGKLPPYERMLRDQYETIQNRFPEWQTKRRPTL